MFHQKLGPFEIIGSMNRKLLVLLALLVIVGIVAYRTLGGDFNWELFFSSLRDVKLGWLSASVVLTLTTYFLRAMRWQVLLAPLKSIRVQPLFWTTIVGFSGIYLLGRAGELVRPLWLTRREGVPLSASIATIIVERVLDSLMLVAMFAWALMVVEVSSTSVVILSQLKSKAWVLAVGVIGAIVMLFVFRSNVSAVARFVRFRKLSAMIENLGRGLAFLGSGKSLMVVLFHSTVLWIAIALQFWFVLLGMHLEFSAGAATLVMVAAAIGSVFQIPVFGGGFQAAYVFCMTTFFSIPTEQAAATALIAYVFSYVPTIVVGGSYMLLHGISMRELKTAVRNPESETV